MALSASPIIRIWSHRNYAIFMGGMTPALLAVWMQRLGVGWLTWELTHSTVWLGAVAAADLAPMLVLAFVAGAVTDRGDALRQLKITEALMLGQAVLLTACTIAGWMTIELLFGLTLFLGFLNPFSAPPVTPLFRRRCRAQILPRRWRSIPLCSRPRALSGRQSPAS